MSDGLSIVLAPVGGEGFVEALSAVDGVSEVAAPDMEGVLGALEGVEVLVSFRWSDDWIVPGLRWIQSVSAGTDQFPVDALREADVVLTSAVGIHDVQVSEHAFGLLLAMTRGIGASVRNQVARDWHWPPVTDLAGMTLGVLGLGVIGEAVAHRAKAFGMEVLGTKRSPDGYTGEADEVFDPDGTLEVFRRSDAVIVTLPATSATAGIVGSAEFEALQGGFFVNVGRGSVVDEAALVEALRSGGLRGAGLDVFEEEPLPESSPLWDMPEVIVSPHLAGTSPRYGERLAELFARNLAAYRGEAEWINRVV
jgi:phosphoglycerate dehydrogenase-like enzyme